jgi:nitrite reductase/ring-hydroxylating ferredoxin subunit
MSGFLQYKEIKQDGQSFLKLCSSADIYEGKAERFFFGDDNDMQIAVFRIRGKLYAVHNICPHRHIDRIHEGIISGLNVMCPEHGWTFSLIDGKNINKKQGVKGLRTFKVFEKNGYVFIEEPDFKTAKWKFGE